MIERHQWLNIIVCQVMSVNVTVEDENDNSPAFDRRFYQGTVRADAAGGDEVDMGGGPVAVGDGDLDDRVEMQLLGKSSELFRVDSDTGRVFVSSPLDSGLLGGDKREKVYLRIRATDQAGHITESQLVIRVIEGEKEVEERPLPPPEITGMAVINRGFVSTDGTGQFDA